MKWITATAILIVTISLVMGGCGKKSVPPTPVRSSDDEQTNPVSGPQTAAQQALTAWQHSDEAEAVSQFLKVDWTARPLFDSNSPLSWSENKFRALPPDDRASAAQQISDQLGTLKRLLAAVTQTGRDAAAKQDISTARQCFTSLKQCGAALDSPESSDIVKLVGQKVEKNADAELAKLGP
jgi:hypothetical protein